MKHKNLSRSSYRHTDMWSVDHAQLLTFSDDSFMTAMRIAMQISVITHCLRRSFVYKNCK